MITVENLTRTYGDFVAVEDVSFAIGKGEIVGMLGHNGAGKTTIMKMLTGYLEPTGGRIEIAGLEIEEHLREIQGRIGYLPENCPVYPEMTVLEYLDYAAALHGIAPAEREERVREAVERTELGPKALQPVATLSRGYRQRVGVAQTLLHHPEILILDEPTNGLDPTQIQHMRQLITSLAEEATVIISTHILQEVQAVCTRVLIMRAGRLALDARMDELQESNSLVVVTDGEEEAIRPLLESISGVADVERCGSQGRDFCYSLRIAVPANRDQVAARVASAILESGHQLYELRPQQQDLETIFGNITAAEGRA